MSEETATKKTWWEVLVALTPLILGICVTGVGVFFTNIYNFRHLMPNNDMEWDARSARAAEAEGVRHPAR